jgi:hypothetical protein
VFLSYKSIEALFALKLAADLKNAGINLWVDRLELGAGDDWGRSIQHAIDACAGMIVVLSPDYVTSRVCRQELARADQMGRPIFPALLETVKLPDYPLELQRLHFSDFRDWTNPSEYNLRVREICGILSGILPTSFCKVPDPETRYLTSLISELEGRLGVHEYVELGAELAIARDDGTVQQPRLLDNWGLDPEFELSIYKPNHSRTPTYSQPISLHNALEVVGRSQRFVLLGEPGAGKTTTLLRLALEAARQRRSNSRTYPLPVVAYLSRWREQTFNDFLRGHWPFHGIAHCALSNGDAEIYLDGLNEMGSEGTDRAQELRVWIKSSGVNRLRVTCRTDDYGSNFDLEIDKVEVKEMDQPRIERFARVYLQESADHFLERIWGGTRNSPLSRLASNPYLLTALMVVYQVAHDKRIPSNNGTLFRSLAQVLWERERRRRTRGWIPFYQMEQEISRLACTMIDEGAALTVSRSYAEEHVRSCGLLDAAVRASFFQMEDADIRFRHQLVLEYFAGVGLIESGIGGRLQPRRFKGGDLRARGHGIKASPWDQAILAMCGLTPRPREVIREV